MSATLTSGGPSSTEWLAAYQGQDARLHLVTSDGKTNSAGPVIPRLSTPGLWIPFVGASPDGHYVAYTYAIADLSHAATPNAIQFRYHVPFGNHFAWSPDSRQLAVQADNQGTFVIDDAATGFTRGVLSTSGRTISELAGWLDRTHLAVRVLGNDTIGLGSLNITDGSLRVIATFSVERLGQPSFQLSPDRAEALVYNRRFRSDPFTPLVAVIDVASGHVRSLPNIAHSTGDGFSTMAWKPGTEIVAASTGYAETGNLHSWILDVGHDTITHLLDGQHIQGWWPNNGPLVVGTGWEALVGEGPYTLSAVAFSASGQPSVTPLTTSAMTFPFLGFARLA